MRRVLLSACSIFVVVAGCGEPEEPLPSDAGGGVDCSAETDGTACGEGRICLAGACAASACGDAFVDTANGEDCEDGNEMAFDGCDPGSCTYTCRENVDCSDGDPCNGGESCTEEHTCMSSGTSAEPGAACTTGEITNGVCDNSPVPVCVAAGVCGNGITEGGEACDDMNADDADGCTAACAYTCTTDVECGDDGDICNGIERCDQLEHICLEDSPPMPRWYRDCDGDGFAANTSGSVESCSMPATAPDCTTAGARWIQLEPTDATNTDCYDESADMRPGQAQFFTTGTSAGLPFDYDCSGTQELFYVETEVVSSGAACAPSGPLEICQGATGWLSGRPGCGASQVWSRCEDTFLSGCVRNNSESRTQACR
jgi:cysteine-rich repeat protein